MPGRGVADRLEAARFRVEDVCARLISPSPEMLDSCSGELESAIAEMAGTVSFLRQAGGDAEALAEAWHLQTAVRRAGTLLEKAADYHNRWARRLASMSEGYRPGGEPAAMAHTGRICLQA